MNSTPTMRVLVSVRNVDEALAAAHAGVDFIDLKEPAAGALGALPLATVRSIVEALRDAAPGMPVSATIGDLDASMPEFTQRAVLTAAGVAACGVDLVKVGIPGGTSPAQQAVARALLAALEHAVVERIITAPVLPVLLADDGVDVSLVRAVCVGRFAGVMLDTQGKLGCSLFDCVNEAQLRAVIGIARSALRMVGLAGALRLHHTNQLQDLAPDFAGFRSAVCDGPRTSALSVERLEALLRALRGVQAVTPLSSNSRMRDTFRLSISSTG
jgi:uncharacterized protein (UPF0264 family)